MFIYIIILHNQMYLFSLIKKLFTLLFLFNFFDPWRQFENRRQNVFNP